MQTSRVNEGWSERTRESNREKSGRVLVDIYLAHTVGNVGFETWGSEVCWQRDHVVLYWC